MFTTLTKRTIAGLVAALALAITLVPADAGAIRYGVPDDGEHPYVGIMVANDADGTPMWRCSGTLMSPTVYVTAGHCTFGAASATIWFEEDLRDTDAVGWPFGGSTSVTGTPHSHPDYDDDRFWVADLGVVVLDEPVAMGAYGTVPDEGFFDPLFTKRGQNKQLFTAVGYGLQRSMPDQTGLTEAELLRLKATLRIINQDAAFGEQKAGNSVLFTNNARGGGTCFGDSGGPIFIEGTTVVAAVTSYGMNSRCAGTGGGYRIDQPDDLEWLATFSL